MAIMAIMAIWLSSNTPVRPQGDAPYLIAQRAVRRARVDRSYSSEGHGQRAESREQEEHTGDKREVVSSRMPLRVPQNEPKRAQDGPKQGQKHPKTTPREPKKRT